MLVKRRVSLMKTKAAKTLQTTPAMLPGAVCVQWARRGDKRRRYYARFWREDGRLRKQYVRQADIEAVTAACAAWREQRQQERQQREAAEREFRRLVRLLRGIGYDD